MARLIQKSGYFKGGSGVGYMRYVAQREGVEITSDTGPVTQKQQKLIAKIQKDFPDTKDSFEYEDYLITPNRATASAYIDAALDSHLHEMEPESGYMKYIAQRPRAEKHGGHGLFSAAPVTDLNKAVAELDAHTGRVWTFIFSLRREDAVQTGYNNAEAWRTLLLQQSNLVSQALRIPPDKLRWYAAFHDEGHHPHVHMMAWSAEPKKGYLTRKGIAVMRSKMTNAIFREEMTELYIKKDTTYKESIQTAKESLLLYIRMLENSESTDPVIEQKLRYLSQTLEQVDGKHVYGYLPKEVKAQVDEIVEQLAQLPEVAACYDQWWRLKDEIAGYYGRNTPPHQPLVLQKEFRAIKNFIIREAETIREPTPVQTSTDAEPSEPQKPLDETPTTVQQPKPAPLQNAIPADAVMQLLHHMRRMFRGNMPVIPPTLRIDSKRRRRLMEKRMAMGHKRDDHEDEQLHHVNDNTMQ